MYGQDKTEASKGALVELGIALGAYRQDIVLVGGWAPFFLSRNHFDHCGSIDIDFVLRPSIMPRYNSIRKIIEELGYTETKNVFRFTRDVPSPISGENTEIELDFLTEPEGGDALSRADLILVQEDLRACLIEGCSIVFTSNYEETISGAIPRNGESSVRLKVANIVGSLAMKGRALQNRLKEKDSYDVYAIAGFYNGDPKEAAKAFLSEVRSKKEGNDLAFIRSSIQQIHEIFSSPSRRGPYDVARFIGDDTIRVDAFQRVNLFASTVKDQI